MTSSRHAPASSTTKVKPNHPKRNCFSPTYNVLYFCLWHAAKKNSHRRNLPRPQDFSDALYTFDIGQNDIAAGIQKSSSENFGAVLPDIIDQLASAVKVSQTKKKLISSEINKIGTALTYVDILAAKYKLISNPKEQGNTCWQRNLWCD